jgi:phospholipase/lecithinase/hemolysin
VAHKHAFHLKNVKKPVWTGNFTDPNSGFLRKTNPAAQNKFLFWDHQHPTAGAHAQLAAVAQTDLFSA